MLSTHETPPMSGLDHYPGYPTQRFTLDLLNNAELQAIDIPEGPWELNNTPLPAPQETLNFIEKGYRIDSLGRPLHPWAETLLSSENGGMVTGKGKYWHWGPNYTADSIVMTNEFRPRVLLIERSDTQETNLPKYALPGGFVDGNEDPYESALRELEEETGLTGVTGGELIYQAPVKDPRTTLHAWGETSAYVFTVDKPADVEGKDDALKAEWHYLDDLPDLFGSHAELIAQAVEAKHPLLRLLNTPESLRETKVVHAGHMAYHHYVTAHNDTSAFVKEHDPAEFTDPFREAHSRAYLVKEHWTYKHLASQGFTSIPTNVELIDDRMLAMDHLGEEDGWLWRAPEDNSEAYIRDILESLTNLQSFSYPDSPELHADIHAAYDTFWQEGWDAIDDENVEKILTKIEYFATGWDLAEREDAYDLVEQFTALREKAVTLSRTPELFTAHNDARQSNIAWNPNREPGKRVKIVDWSWADKAPLNADTTMFLIDLAKSGYNVNDYKELFNHDYAVTLIGFWLAHSIWETRDGSSTVREHQIASAASALRLIESFSAQD